MHKLLSALAFSAVVSSSAPAQLQSSKPQPITTAIKDAGVYYVATGTWTRGATAAALAGPDVIYDNTCEVGYYFGVTAGDVVLDSGRVPSTSSPMNASSLTGSCDLYEVNCFTFGYCEFTPSVTNIDISFFDCYSACDAMGVLPSPVATFNIVNAPGGSAAGGQGCWIITLNLSNSGQTFNLGGDCNGTYDNVAQTDSFGWAWSAPTASVGSNRGPIFAGDPAGLYPQSGVVCGGIGGGTTFVGAGPGPGTGVGILDQMELLGGPTAPGCYWFGGYGGSGGNPFTSFYMRLSANACSPQQTNAFCFGDGTGNACPCGNSGGVGDGCANSAGTGARMTSMGFASYSTDTLGMQITGVSGSKPGLLIRGNNALNGGLGLPAGDGLLCVSGASQRSHVQVTSPAGDTFFSNWNGQPFGSVANPVGVPTFFQYWYRDPMGSPCGFSFNFSNADAATYVP